jgi:hypothetical protein
LHRSWLTLLAHSQISRTTKLKWLRLDDIDQPAALNGVPSSSISQVGC